jgi:hypothetical protein
MTRPRRLVLTLLIALVCALALAPAALAAPATNAHARAALGGPGTLDGNLIDGTTNGGVIANQTVTLALTGGSGSQQIASTVTDAGGNFHFASLATDASDIYVASTRYQGVLYSADPITLDTNPHPRETLLAYQSNSDASKIGIARLVIEIREPDVSAGTIGVAELASVVNGNPYTFLGSSTPINGQPMNLLRFGLPPGAENLATNDDFNQGQNIQVDRGFATTAAVPPGSNQFTFAYDYPYSGTRSVFTFDAIYPTEQVVVIAPSDMTITAPRFTALGTVKSGSQTVQAWQVNALPAGQSASLELSRLPPPGQQNTLSLPWLYVIAALIALLAVGAVGYRLRTAPNRSPVRGRGERRDLSPTPSPARGGEPDSPSPRGGGGRGVGAAPKSLLLALARLDRDHEAGDLDDDAYRVQRGALKTELKARMLAREEGASAVGAASTADGARATGKGART